MKHYIVIGYQEPGGLVYHWSGPEQSAEHARRRFMEDAWGETTDPEDREAAQDEGYAPYVELVFVSDTPISLTDD